MANAMDTLTKELLPLANIPDRMIDLSAAPIQERELKNSPGSTGTRFVVCSSLWSL